MQVNHASSYEGKYKASKVIPYMITFSKRYEL